VGTCKYKLKALLYLVAKGHLFSCHMGLKNQGSVLVLEIRNYDLIS
jgi:hypothetical protein